MDKRGLNGLRTAWAMIEGRRAFPVILSVVAATPIEDTARIARGLATLASEAGRRAGVVHLDGGVREGQAERSDALVEPLSATELDVAMVTWRREYDFVVVSTRETLADSVRAYAASGSDLVIVATCGKRNVGEQDRDLRAFLDHSPALVLGAVTTEAVRRMPGDRRGNASESSVAKGARQPSFVRGA